MTSPLPFEAEAAAQAWGRRVAIARKTRRWTLRDLAAKAGIGPNTAVQVERGDPQVGLGNWLRVFWALDLLDEFSRASRLSGDSVDAELLAERLPQRVRR
ncbi:MAG: transcription factor [Betaproteobacteria bacterium]|nr:transcription factor [Betaproteobacteria bacterium]